MQPKMDLDYQNVGAHVCYIRNASSIAKTNEQTFNMDI